jgi:hypothetical protein
VDLDPLEQRATYPMHAGMRRDGDLLRQEGHTLHINFYFMNETLLLPERAGFTDVVVHAGHREEAPTGDDDFIVFVATKP